MAQQQQDNREILNRVRVASPCSASWEEMPGGERVRSCEKCARKVYNLSGMSASDAAKLVREAEGQRLCVRFYRRPDGSLMTRDCPVGASLVRRRLARALSCGFASLLFVGGALTQSGRMRAREQAAQLRQDEQAWRSAQPAPVQNFLNQVDPPLTPECPPTQSRRELAVMGDIAALPAPEEMPAAAVPPSKPFLQGQIETPPASPRPDPFVPLSPDVRSGN